LTIETVSASKFSVTLLEPKIIEIQHFDNVEIEVDDLHEVTDISMKLVNYSPYAVLILPGKFTTFSLEARELGASDKLEGDRVATALVAKSLPYKLIGNFYLQFNKPTSTTKMFKTRDAALDWLREKLSEVPA